MSTHAIDVAEGASQNGKNGDINGGGADEVSSKELEGLRSINLTPTSPSSEATHTKADAIPGKDERRTSRPPVVLKSAPGIPSAEETRLNDLLETLRPRLLRCERRRTTKWHRRRSRQTSNAGNLIPTHSDIRPLLAIKPPQFQTRSILRPRFDSRRDARRQHGDFMRSREREDESGVGKERFRTGAGEAGADAERPVDLLRGVLWLPKSADTFILSASTGRCLPSFFGLMEKSVASSSAKQSAEAKHKQMESELSDLSANLLSTANEMVATERQARAQAEESLVSAQATAAALEKQLEDAKTTLNQEEIEKEILQDSKDRTEQEMVELRRAMRGVNSSNVTTLGSGGVLRIMNSHLPYKSEYLGFLAHLRGMAGSTPNIPAITSLLTLPFLARLVVEDFEPTLRLDLAPSLNWLTRRSVLTAIHSNTLLIEQIHVATLFLEGSSSSYPSVGFGSGSSLPTCPTQLTKVNCALCGKVVYMSPEAIQAEENRNQLSVVITESPTTPTPHSIPTSSTTPSPHRTGSGSSWVARKLVKSVTLPSLGGAVARASGSRSNSPTPRHSLDSTMINGSGPSTPITTTLERSPLPPPPTSLQTVIHAFRVPSL